METRTRYIYRITNLVNGKTYIGQHTVRANRTVTSDTYMGSGVILRKAFTKYGKENFHKEILICGFYTKDEINRLEVEAIINERSLGKAEYNILSGGEGFDSEGAKRSNAAWMEKYGKEKLLEMSKRVNELFSEKRSAGVRRYFETHSGSFLGKTHSEDTKQKMSETAKSQNRTGANNGSFGKHWFTNGKENIKCEQCPDGFRPGRTLK